MRESNYFDQLLNAFWLRPETALWRAIDIQAMHGFKFQSPSLDMGCGDGVFSFIRAGGEFEDSFDVFQSTTRLDKFFDDVDVYDSFDESVSAQVKKTPDYKIDWAFDHKENLLKKAGLLGLYRDFKIGDANQPLPFSDNSFASIFSNIVYWLDDPKSTLKEIFRILKPGGEVCLMLPNDTLPEFSFFNLLHQGSKPEWKFLEWLDRGRLSDNIKQAKSASEWESLFKEAGLTVDDHRTHLSKTVIQMWDIGLRPMFPVFMKMIQAIAPEKLQDIKSDWKSIVGHFLKPIALMDSQLQQGVPAAFHCYILRKCI